MKILILSCNTGEGHNSAAKAIKYYFDRDGDECVMADALSFVSNTMSKIVCGGHVFIYRRVPSMFDLVYNGAEVFAKKENSKHDTIIFKLLALGAKKLYNFIQEGNYDRIVCFHPFAAQMLTKVYRDHDDVGLPTYLIATDYVCSPGAGESKLDAYITPHEGVEYEFTKRCVKKDRIVPIGIPINPAFSDLPSKEEARTELGISPESRVIVLMFGSMGCGPIKKMAEKMAAKTDGNKILYIVCGRNEKLRKKLAHLENDHVHVLGFCTQMPLYMSAADLFVTKPGGLSTTESASARLPMLLIDAVAGCETYNYNFFVDNGYAFGAETVDAMVDRAHELVLDEAALEETRKKLEENFACDNAYRIYKYVKEGRTPLGDAAKKEQEILSETSVPV